MPKYWHTARLPPHCEHIRTSRKSFFFLSFFSEGNKERRESGAFANTEEENWQKFSRKKKSGKGLDESLFSWLGSFKPFPVHSKNPPSLRGQKRIHNSARKVLFFLGRRPGQFIAVKFFAIRKVYARFPSYTAVEKSFSSRNNDLHPKPFLIPSLVGTKSWEGC